MSIRLEELPLFPLNAVLLPYQTLPVNVFEDRYRDMIRTCASMDQPFGIVLIREGEEVGDDNVEALPRRHLRTHRQPHRAPRRHAGPPRSSARDRSESDALSAPSPTSPASSSPSSRWSGAPTPPTAASSRAAQEAFEIHLRNMFGRQDVNITVSFPDDPVALSFAMAGFVSLTPRRKAALPRDHRHHRAPRRAHPHPREPRPRIRHRRRALRRRRIRRLHQ